MTTWSEENARKIAELKTELRKQPDGSDPVAVATYALTRATLEVALAIRDIANAYADAVTNRSPDGL